MPAGGRVVALSSLGSQRVIPGYVAIGVSKAALEALTRYLAVELGRQGITVNAVSAGAVETDVWHMIPDGAQALEAIRARTPGGRLVTPEAGADVVFFLASPAGRGLQGQVLTVEGGARPRRGGGRRERGSGVAAGGGVRRHERRAPRSPRARRDRLCEPNGGRAGDAVGIRQGVRAPCGARPVVPHVPPVPRVQARRRF